MQAGVDQGFSTASQGSCHVHATPCWTENYGAPNYKEAEGGALSTPVCVKKERNGQAGADQGFSTASQGSYVHGTLCWNPSTSSYPAFFASPKPIFKMATDNVAKVAWRYVHLLSVVKGLTSQVYMHEQSMNHISLKKYRPRCYVKWPTAQDQCFGQYQASSAALAWFNTTSACFKTEPLLLTNVHTIGLILIELRVFLEFTDFWIANLY